MLNSLPFWSKQTTRRWRSLCSCVLWSFLSFKTTWSDLFLALCKVPWFFVIGWQMGKTGFYLSVIFPQAFSYKQTLLAMWISYFSQDAEQLAMFTFYVFTDLDKVSVHKHKNFITCQKSLVKPIFNFVHFYAPFLQSITTMTFLCSIDSAHNSAVLGFLCKEVGKENNGYEKSTIKRKWCVHMIFSLKCLHKCVTRVCMQFAFLVQQNVVTL